MFFRGKDREIRVCTKIARRQCQGWPFPLPLAFFTVVFSARDFPWESLHRTLINTVFCVQLSQFEFSRASSAPGFRHQTHMQSTWKMSNFRISFFEKIACHRSAEKKKAYTTTTERKSFGGSFLASKKNFRGRWWIQKPYKNQESHIHHRNLSSVDPIFFLQREPKGPFRTRNSMAPESVVFCCRRSFLVSVPFSCLLFLGKQALLSSIRSVLRFCRSVFFSRRSEFALRTIFSTEGSFGKFCTGAGRCMVSYIPSSGKSHCGNFRGSAPQSPRSVNGQP